MSKTETIKKSDPDVVEHPVSAGVGAAGGGAAGAAVGTAFGGPVGGVIGAAIGAVLGGATGEGVAEALDPRGEDEYWREIHSSRSDVNGEPFETYRPAYVYGYELRRRTPDSRFEELESDIERGWDRFEDKSELKWEQAKTAVRDGWNRFENSVERLFDDEDEYWRSSYAERPYVTVGEPYDTYRPAYRYGYRSRVERLDDRWDAIEDDLERGWDRFKNETKLTWHQAKDAVRDGWHHVERKLPGDFDRDGR